MGAIQPYGSVPGHKLAGPVPGTPPDVQVRPSAPGPDPVFFFQAEDGIRDKLVTGVQTCVLPIWRGSVPSARSSGSCTPNRLHSMPTQSSARSEERRVGKSVDLGGRRIIKKK